MCVPGGGGVCKKSAPPEDNFWNSPNVQGYRVRQFITADSANTLCRAITVPVIDYELDDRMWSQTSLSLRLQRLQNRAGGIVHHCNRCTV